MPSNRGFVLTVKLDTVDQQGNVSAIRLEIPMGETMYLTALEVLTDGRPVLRQPFYYHGEGYHTVCRFAGEIDAVRNVQVPTW